MGMGLFMPTMFSALIITPNRFYARMLRESLGRVFSNANVCWITDLKVADELVSGDWFDLCITDMSLGVAATTSLSSWTMLPRAVGAMLILATGREAQELSDWFPVSAVIDPGRNGPDQIDTLLRGMMSCPSSGSSGPSVSDMMKRAVSESAPVQPNAQNDSNPGGLNAPLANNVRTRHSPVSPLVAGAIRMVGEAIAEPIAPAEVARRLRVNQSYLCRLFKRETKRTLTSYIAEVRVMKVREMLRNPALRVTEIALAAGFGSVTHFNMVFKKNTGMSPTQYRRNIVVKN